MSCENVSSRPQNNQITCRNWQLYYGTKRGHYLWTCHCDCHLLQIHLSRLVEVSISMVGTGRVRVEG